MRKIFKKKQEKKKTGKEENRKRKKTISNYVYKMLKYYLLSQSLFV